MQTTAKRVQPEHTLRAMRVTASSGVIIKDPGRNVSRCGGNGAAALSSSPHVCTNATQSQASTALDQLRLIPI